MLSLLPLEIQSLVISYTNQKDLLSLSQVSLIFNELASDHLYQNLIISNSKSYNHIPSLCLIKKQNNFTNKYQSLIPLFENNRHLHKIKSVQILNINDYLFNYDDSLNNFVSFLVEHCPNLTNLDTPFKFNLMDLVPNKRLGNLNIISSNLQTSNFNIQDNIKRLNTMIYNNYNLITASTFKTQIDNLYKLIDGLQLNEFYLNTNDIYGIRPDFMNYMAHLFEINNKEALVLDDLNLSISHDLNFHKCEEDFQKTGELDDDFFQSIVRVFQLQSVERLSLNVYCNKSKCDCDEYFFKKISSLNLKNMKTLKIETTLNHSNENLLKMLNQVSDQITQFEFSNGIFNNLPHNKSDNMHEFINVLKNFRNLQECNLISLLINLKYHCDCYKCHSNYHTNSKFTSLAENYYIDSDSDESEDSEDDDQEQEEFFINKPYVPKLKQTFQRTSLLSSLQPMTMARPCVQPLQNQLSSISLSRIPSLNIISNMNCSSAAASSKKISKFNELIYHLYQNNFKNYYNCSPPSSNYINFINFYDEFNFKNGVNKYGFLEKNFNEIITILIHSIIPYINELQLDSLKSLNVGGLIFEIGKESDDSCFITLKNFKGFEKIYI